MNATDKRFFWLALYAQPGLWVALAVVAIVKFEFIWLTLVVIALVLTITNTLAFSRCDKFSQASGLVERGLYSGSLVSWTTLSRMVEALLMLSTGTKCWRRFSLTTLQPWLIARPHFILMPMATITRTTNDSPPNSRTHHWPSMYGLHMRMKQVIRLEPTALIPLLPPRPDILSSPTQLS